MERTTPALTRTSRLVAAGMIAALAIGLGATTVDAAKARTKLVSVKSNGKQGKDNSSNGFVSANGRFIAFSSVAENLVKNDTNGRRDVFVHDRKTKKTTRVSVKSNGKQVNGDSDDPSISANGRYVAFVSAATNITKNAGSPTEDIFVHDRKTKKTRRVNYGTQPGAMPVIVQPSHSPEISGNGRYVVWASAQANFIADDENDTTDVFIHDRKLKKTRLISKSSNGKQGSSLSKHPSISHDGRFVAFESHADDLVVGDDNGDEDVFVRDRKKGRTKRVSVSSAGLQGSGESDDPAISGNGRFIAFETKATIANGDGDAVADVVIHDRKKKTTKLLSKNSSGQKGNMASGDATISFDGRLVAFESNATNLVGTDLNVTQDIYVHDRKKKKTRRANVPKGGGEPSIGASQPRISADGRFVTFQTNDPSLVGNDTNGLVDVFRRGPLH